MLNADLKHCQQADGIRVCELHPQPEDTVTRSSTAQNALFTGQFLVFDCGPTYLSATTSHAQPIWSTTPQPAEPSHVSGPDERDAGHRSLGSTCHRVSAVSFRVRKLRVPGKHASLLEQLQHTVPS